MLNELFNGLKSLVTLLHSKQALLPVLQQSFLAHDDSLDFDGSLFESVPGCGRFLLLRYELGLIQGLLFIQPLDFLVHRVDQQILLLLGLFKVSHVFFSTISCAASDGDFALHNLIVLLYLL